jgi:glycosyltransferase involved in cell wall biosynthesis
VRLGAWPFALIHRLYHAAVPHKRRLIFWSWRRRKTFHLRLLRESLRRDLVRACQAEIRQILSRYPDAPGVVIFPPSVPWYTELFQRPQQMARGFTSLGYIVLYWVEDIDKQDESVRFREVGTRLYLCKVPPSAFWVCKRPIFISYTYNYQWQSLLRAPIIVYEVIDHLSIFSNFPISTLRRYHRRLLHRAHLVVGTADDLLVELKPQRPDAILCPNGVDLAHFATITDARDDDIPADMRSIVVTEQPVIGYYGAMAEWFDFDLVKFAAKALPNFQFVLIGPDYDGLTMRKAGISDYANIHWLGPKTYKELPRYLACFDVATIPFKVSDALNAVSPIKLFEYMAGERPIVTTDLTECRKYPVVLIARSQEEWTQRLQEAVGLRGDHAYRERLRTAAEENTWVTRALTEIKGLEARNVIAPRAHSLVLPQASSHVSS